MNMMMVSTDEKMPVNFRQKLNAVNSEQQNKICVHSKEGELPHGSLKDLYFLAVHNCGELTATQSVVCSTEFMHFMSHLGSLASGRKIMIHIFSSKCAALLDSTSEIIVGYLHFQTVVSKRIQDGSSQESNSQVKKKKQQNGL